MKESILFPAALEARIIPNGVDLSVFQPANKKFAREIIGIMPEKKVILFVSLLVFNFFKDFHLLKSAISLLIERDKEQNILFIVLGGEAPPEFIGRVEIRFVPFQAEANVLWHATFRLQMFIFTLRALKRFLRQSLKP